LEHELHPALTASGRFQVKDCLGSGGFGVVFDVFDAEAQARVALKWLRNSDASTIARFKREFRSLADLSHPNLVRFRELITVAGEWFFTMDLVVGVELLRHVRPASPVEPESFSRAHTSMVDSEKAAEANAVNGSSIANGASTGSTGSDNSSTLGSTVALSRQPSIRPGALPTSSGMAGDDTKLEGRPLCGADLRRLRSTLEQLGAGLDAIHAAGMLHRDVKPSNVLVSREGRVVLLDFGLVTSVGDDGIALTNTGKIVGTPAYMSPEQAMGMPLTPSSDWYAVGVILYQALTGQLPFDGEAQGLLVRKQLADAVNPQEHVRGVPKALAELCLDLLSRDPKRRPMGAEFLERLRSALPNVRVAGDASVAPNGTKSSGSFGKLPSLSPATFVGRETHVWALDEALDEAEHGKTVIALVHGSSGMGKTSLVRQFLDNVRETRPEVVLLEGRCYERESVPYKALDSLIDSLARYLQRLPEMEAAKLLPRDMEALARVFPVFLQVEAAGTKRSKTRTDIAQERRRAFDALRELLARVADRAPLVLFIDDLQWGDGDSEPLLTALLRPPDPPALLLAAAYRTEDAPAAPLVRTLRKLASAGAPLEACEIPVGELSPEDASQLAATLLGGRGGVELAGTLARESHGSPLFLRQLAAMDPGDETSPKIELAKALRRQIAALSDDARSLLETLAVSGRPILLSAAARAAGIEKDPQGVLSTLRAATLVRTRGIEARDEVEIYHERIREIVVSNLSEETLRSRHSKLARVLSATGDADAEALASHYFAGGEKELAAEYAEKAGERATEALAFARAAQMYEMALGLGSTLNRGSDGLKVKLAEALVSAGRGKEAAERFLQAARGATPSAALELRRRAAEQLLFSGHIAEGTKVVEQILAAMNMKQAQSTLGAVISFLWWRFLLFVRGHRFRERSAEQISSDRLVRIDTCFSLGVGLAMVDPLRGQEFQTRYLLLALQAGEPVRIARGLALEAAYRSAGGARNAPVVARLLARAMAIAEQTKNAHAIAFTQLMTGVSRVLIGDFRKAVELCDAAVVELREKCTAVAWELDNAAYFTGFSLVTTGRLKELGERLPAFLEDAKSRGDLYGEVLLRMQCAYFVNLARGDVDRARADLATFGEDWAAGQFRLQHAWQMINRVDIAMYEGNAKRAWKPIAEVWARLEKSMFLRTESMRMRSHYARARAALLVAYAAKDVPRMNELLEIAKADARIISKLRWPVAQGFAALVDASVLGVSGDKKGAEQRLREAIAELEMKDSKLQVECARFALGELIGGTEGDKLVARAWKELGDAGVADAEKFSRVYVLCLPSAAVRSPSSASSSAS